MLRGPSPRCRRRLRSYLFNGCSCMAARTKSSFANSSLSRATRALFGFLFRNALPVDASMTLALPEDDISRRRARALAGAGLLATTYRPGVDLKGTGALSSTRISTQPYLPAERFV